MVKHYCDRCNEEITEEIRFLPTFEIYIPAKKQDRAAMEALAKKDMEELSMFFKGLEIHNVTNGKTVRKTLCTTCSAVIIRWLRSGKEQEQYASQKN